MQSSWPVTISLSHLIDRTDLPASLAAAYRDAESKTYYAINQQIGLAAEADTFEGLILEIESAVPDLLR